MKNIYITIILIVSLLQSDLFAEDAKVTSSLCEALDFVIQPPLFSPSKETPLSAEEIVEKVHPILKQQLAKMNYDRTFPILQFLDHYENCQKKNKSILPIEAYKTFKFEPILLGMSGGPCVSLTFDIYNRLPAGIEGYIVAAQLPVKYQQLGFPKFSHTAVLIKYKNPSIKEDEGYILLDPSFDIDEPIVLKGEHGSFLYDMKGKGIWKFSIEADNIICDILPKQNAMKQDNDENFWRMTYLTSRLVNPIESSAMPMILTDRRLSLLSRREDGTHIVHLNIELNKNRVVWDQAENWFDPISFIQFTHKKWLFPDWFACSLGLSASDLSKKILRIIENKKILDSLYASYLKLLNDTKDFTITGNLDEEVLEITLGSFKE